jgi:UDP-glucose 4-epimerase
LDRVRVLITGGAGFIGSHLGDALLARGYQVIAVDNLSKGTRDNIAHNAGKPGFSFVELDVLEHEALVAAAGDRIDVVVHLAAAKIPRYESAMKVVMANFEGAHSALELARKHQAKCVLASTSDVYGKSPSLPFAEDGDLVIGPSTSRRWAYAVSKLCDEHMAFAYQDDFGIPVVPLRFFGCYGERQYLSWWGGPQGVFLEAIAKGEPIELHGDGQQTRCFIHVRDLAEGIARAVERPAANGEILNIGFDEEVSIARLAELMHRLSGVGGEPKVKMVPYQTLSKNYEDVRRRIPDMTKMKRILEWVPRIRLEEGIRSLWAWYWGRK